MTRDGFGPGFCGSGCQALANTPDRFPSAGSDGGGVGGTFRRALKDLSRAPAPKQMAVGAAVGWAAGYATMKVGKMAATAVGGSLLILQVR